MKNVDKQHPGYILKHLNEEIRNLERTLECVRAAAKSEDMSGSIIRGEASHGLFASFQEQIIGELQLARDALAAHMSNCPPPARASLKCPHCGYDGEFDAESPTGVGFRLLEPILQPRLIMSYDGMTIAVSDPTESFDPFDMISDPAYHEYLDESEDEIERGIRKDLRGRHIIVCGNQDCLKYFDGRPFATRCILDYSGENGYKSKWGENF